MRFLEILYVGVCLSVQAAAVTFTPGAICDGIDIHLPVSARLSGKHLNVANIQWEPFGIYDSTKTGNDAWTGYDVDMLNLVAKQLNFTYTISKKEKPSTDTWDDHIINVVNQSDLHLGFWMGTPTRRSAAWLGLGHVDSSYRVLTNKPVVIETSLLDEILTVFQPFTPGLWAMLVGMLLLAALVQMVLESPGDTNDDYARSRNHFDMYVTTFWLFSTQITNTNAGSPVTGPGRFFIAFMGFVFVVMLCAYTANLAAFLSAPPPLFSVQAVEDLERNALPVCLVTYTEGVKELLLRFHPTLNVVLNTQSEAEATMKLKDKTCDAVIVDSSTVMGWLVQPHHCGLHLVGPTVLAKHSGWFTNHLSPCINQAFEFAMQRIMDDGLNVDLWNKWVPVAKCPKKAVVENHDDLKLSIAQMASIFTFFGVAACTALAAAYHEKGNQIFIGPHGIKDSQIEMQQQAEPDMNLELRGLREDMSEMRSQVTMLTAALLKVSGIELPKNMQDSRMMESVEISRLSQIRTNEASKNDIRLCS